MIEVAHPDRWATSILEGFVTVYLGTLGRMIPIYSTPSAQLETEDRYSFTTTLEGRRKAQTRPVGRRTWGLNAQFADPAEHSLLSQFANGAWGPGPFVFVSADAPVTNMLTPSAAQSMIVATSGVTLGGPMLSAGGVWSPQSIMTNGATTVYFDSARYLVIGGRMLTFSADVVGGGAKVLLAFYGSAGEFISTASSTNVGVPGTATRLSVSAFPPSGAVSVQVGFSNAVQGTHPTLTWSDRDLGWSDGQGCLKAVVHGFTRDQVLAVAGKTFSNVSFTVSEVG